MGILEKLRSRHTTAYITINSRNCAACRGLPQRLPQTGVRQD